MWGIKIFKTVVFLLVVVLLANAVSASILPDNEPVLSFDSNTNSAETVAVLTAVAVDTLTNAQISYIEIYEDDELLGKKECTSSTCTFVKTVVETNPKAHKYYARVKDVGGHVVVSDNVQVEFEGIEIKHFPVIVEKKTIVTYPGLIGGFFGWMNGLFNPNYQEQTSLTSIFITTFRNLTFEVNVTTLDDTQVVHNWAVRDKSKSGQSLAEAESIESESDDFSYLFDEPGEYEVVLTSTDAEGQSVEQEWDVTVEDSEAPPEITGTVVDIDTGEPVEGINISVYNASIYDVFNDTGDYTALEPKDTPDTATGSDGSFKVYQPLEDSQYYNLVMQGSKEIDFNIKKTKQKIILPETGKVKITVEKASMFSDIDLYFGEPNGQKVIDSISEGDTYTLSSQSNGTELKFYIKVNGDYDHESDSKYARVEQIDENSWKIHFEDLPASTADWDFNDAVILVDLLADVSEEYTLDPYENTVNAEIDEDRVKTNLNAEGHLLYSGKYGGENKYACGDLIRFTMFGVNNGGTDENITFAVQDHTSIGGPTAPIIYNGSISDPDEKLTIPAGNKEHGVFEYTLQCPLAEGRYDVHVVWDNETWHKIGNFFVVNDTTAPEVNGIDSASTYTNQSVLIGINVVDTAQPNTIRIQEASTMGNASNIQGITVYVHKDTNTSDIPLDEIINNKDYSVSASSNFDLNLTYNESGHYTAGIFAVDESGNIGKHFVDVDVFITEEEADVIGDAIYTLFGLDIFLTYDYNYTVTTSSPNIHLVWDRFTDDNNYGDEYITADDGFNGFNGINITEISAVEKENYEKTGPEYALPIYPMIMDEYNYTLTSFFYWLKCGINSEPLVGPSCNTTNFAPEIWKCNPGDGVGGIPCIPADVGINATEAAPLSISVVDPNDDDYSIYWYDDDELVETNSTSYTFVANESLIGSHIIKVIALDQTGENISISNGPHNSWEWNLTVT